MGIPLNNTERGEFTPSITLPTIGDKLDFAVINEQVVPAYVFNSNPKVQATTSTGKPKTQDLLTVVVIKGSALIVDTDADGKAVTDGSGDQVRRQVREGDVGAIYIEGQSRFDPDVDKPRTKDQPRSWSAVKEEIGGLNVGDVGRWVYEGDQQGKGAQPRKIRKFMLRRPKPEEQTRTTRCEDLYRERTAIKIGAGVGGGGGVGHDVDDDPF